MFCGKMKREWHVTMMILSIVYMKKELMEFMNEFLSVHRDLKCQINGFESLTPSLSFSFLFFSSSENGIQILKTKIESMPIVLEGN